MAINRLYSKQMKIDDMKEEKLLTKKQREELQSLIDEITKEAKKVYGTTDIAHTGVRYLFENGGDICLGGKVVGIEHPHHHDFLDIRLSPEETRDFFQKNNWNKVVDFQTPNPPHSQLISVQCLQNLA